LPRRSTASTAAVLLIVLAVEGVTVLRVRLLLTPHVFLGMLLVLSVPVEDGRHDLAIRAVLHGRSGLPARGPPLPLLRLLGPIVVVLTASVLATGIALLLGALSWRSQLLVLHRASFLVWFFVMTLQVLGHLLDSARSAPRDWLCRTRHHVDGAGARQDHRCQPGPGPHPGRPGGAPGRPVLGQ
jgi:hypothetical protein